MSENHCIAWFDCGTTNTRLYLIAEDGTYSFCGGKAVGSRNVAIEGSSTVLAQAMAQLLQKAPESAVQVYASGMVTSAFGLKEIPHLTAPVSAAQLREAITEVFVEELGRSIRLIPGVRTETSDWHFAGNVRGEETEVLGAAALLESRDQCSDGVYVLPGSHTQILYLKEGAIVDILSLFTGELFHALQEETILSAILKRPPDSIDPEFVRRGSADGITFGVNRALYLCHSNQIFRRFTDVQRYSYAEGVLLGGVYQALAQRLQHSWASCPNIFLVCNELNWNIYRALLQNGSLPNVLWLPPETPGCFGVRGLRSIVEN